MNDFQNLILIVFILKLKCQHYVEVHYSPLLALARPAWGKRNKVCCSHNSAPSSQLFPSGVGAKGKEERQFFRGLLWKAEVTSWVDHCCLSCQH